MKQTKAILTVIMFTLIGAFIGMALTQKYYVDLLQDFKADAVMNECGFWNVNGEFDWKPTELKFKFEDGTGLTLKQD